MISTFNSRLSTLLEGRSISLIRVLMVCLGNICRSPMAEFIFREMAEKRGILEQSVYQIISKAKRLGYKCRYIVVDEEDEP